METGANERGVTFRAMGTTIEVRLVGVGEAEMSASGDLAKRLAERWEETFSRFRPDSELSRINAAGGGTFHVSEDMLWMFEKAIAAFHKTAGRFDPTVLASLVAAGYDRDIEQVRRSSARSVSAVPPGIDGIRVDGAAATVTIPEGVGIDFGGIAKGAFVDRLAIALMRYPGGCVDAGGDLRVWGQPPSGDHWVIGIEHPLETERDIARVQINDPRAAAIATSAINRRRWTTESGEQHHLIDPRSGRPAGGHVLSCSAFAGTAVDAEVATKSLFAAASRGEPLDPADAIAGLVIEEGERLQLVKRKASEAYTFFSMAQNG